MNTILVVNAGSSSIKFQVFGVDERDPQCLIRGQMDGIGTRPRLRASEQSKSAVDRTFRSEEVPDIGAALNVAAAWLRTERTIDPIAVGHRVVHGGPEYERPVLIDREVLSRLERYAPLAPLHQPNNLAP